MASKGRDLGNIVSPKTGIAVTISGDPVVLGVGNTELVRIWANDRIGINTTDSTRQINIGGVPDETENVIDYDVSMGATTGYAQLRLTTNATATQAAKYLIAYQNGHSSYPNELSLKNLGGDITFVASPDGGPSDERLRITSGGRISINNTSGPTDIPGTSHDTVVVGNPTATAGGITLEVASSGSDCGFQMYAQGSQPCSRFLYASSNNTTQIWTQNSGGTSESTRMIFKEDGDVSIANGNLVFSTAGTGIDFSATADGSGTVNGEIFDDYEEGQWTPSITFGTGNTGLTHSEQVGQYRKIGKMVFCTALVTLSAKGTSTGTMEINGLPFACSDANPSDSGRIAGFLTFFNNFSSLNSMPALYGVHNATKCRLIHLNDHDGTGTDDSPITDANTNNSTQFRAYIAYPSD